MPTPSSDADPPAAPGEEDARPTHDLRREVGVPGAVFMGLGSIVGTGLFVSLGVAAGIAGNAILLALPLAALLALFNGLSSAQLAAAHPVSGGTYAYGRRFLNAEAGYAAGILFLLAKSASAATAALGFAGYLLVAFGLADGQAARTMLALAGVGLLTFLTAGGIRRSNRANLVIVGVTFGVFVVFLLLGLFRLGGEVVTLLDPDPWNRGLRATRELTVRWFQQDVVGGGAQALLHATALLFVAYTGYGRIATLGEEVRDPERTIPRSIGVTLAVVAVLYLGVAGLALATLGAEGFARETATTAAPLQAVAEVLRIPGLPLAMAVAAVTAMLGVLLNLVLGLSRVAFAMGRAGDLPGVLSTVHAPTGSPRVAVWATGGVIAALVLLGDVRLTWSFSAFTVLAYYGITNLSALRLPPEARRYPRIVPVLGLGGCVLLAFFVPPAYWAAGVGLLALAFGLRRMAHRGGGRGTAGPAT